MHAYKPHYVIPIPSSYEKKQSRGYNQVDQFFYNWVLSFTNHEHDTFKDKQNSNRPILEDCEDKCFQWFDCLYKLDTHKEMWLSSGSERRNTIEDAFLWNNNFDSSLIRDKRILLVDDIYTTGATLESASRVLRRYSPQTIEALTIASGSF